jgi:rod shape-determining protein MreD
MKRFAILLLGGSALIFVQAVPWLVPPYQVLIPNFSLVYVVFVALYSPCGGSWLVAFALGFLLEALSGAPAGMFSLINLFSFFLVRALTKLLLFEGALSQTVLVFALYFLAGLAALSIARAATPFHLASILRSLLVQSLFVALASIPFVLFGTKKLALSSGEAPARPLVTPRPGGLQ